MVMIQFKAVALLVSSIFLGGCAAKSVTIYKWEGYQSNIYKHFRGDPLSQTEQTQSMESDLQKIHASGLAEPPGYQAHPGLL
jgi:hypothetical protein